MKRILGYLMIGFTGVFILAGCGDTNPPNSAPVSTNTPPSTNAPAK